MKERPILFSAPMIRAILDDSKTQTRRLVTRATSEVGTGIQWGRLDFSDAYVDPGGTEIFGPGPYLKVKCPDDDTRHRVYPRFEPGMRLWVRETWSAGRLRGDVWTPWHALPKEHRSALGVTDLFYRATPGCEPEDTKWIPGIHMPRWASRITFEITDVRAERLNEISPYDVEREGIRLERCGCETCRRSVEMCTADASAHVEEFWHLWDHINGKRAPWASNPFVWVVGFRRIAP